MVGAYERLLIDACASLEAGGGLWLREETDYWLGRLRMMAYDYPDLLENLVSRAADDPSIHDALHLYGKEYVERGGDVLELHVSFLAWKLGDLPRPHATPKKTRDRIIVLMLDHRRRVYGESIASGDFPGDACKYVAKIAGRSESTVLRIWKDRPKGG